MPALSDLPFDQNKETGFRRGYVHGAQSVINAVSPHISDTQASRLLVWMNQLQDWQAGGDFEPPAPPDLSVTDNAGTPHGGAPQRA
jgi:hypothetical protein